MTTTQTSTTHSDAWQAAMGTTDPATWRAVPAACNPAGNPDGAWAVVAGDGEEADIYCEVTAEHPQQVAELIAEAIRVHAGVETATERRAAAERERLCALVPADTLDGLADWMTRIGAEFTGPAAIPDLASKLKLLAEAIREGEPS
jgi:phosphatidate phosphatase APP1